MNNQIQTAIELRDRATQVALNFVGHSISSSDGSYELLIQAIYDALQEVAEGYRKIIDDIHFRAAAEAALAEFAGEFWKPGPPSVSGNEGRKVPVEPIITEEK